MYTITYSIPLNIEGNYATNCKGRKVYIWEIQNNNEGVLENEE
jgi:hypothetical protein